MTMQYRKKPAVVITLSESAADDWKHAAGAAMVMCREAIDAVADAIQKSTDDDEKAELNRTLDRLVHHQGTLNDIVRATQ